MTRATQGHFAASAETKRTNVNWYITHQRAPTTWRGRSLLGYGSPLAYEWQEGAVAV